MHVLDRGIRHHGAHGPVADPRPARAAARRSSAAPERRHRLAREHPTWAGCGRRGRRHRRADHGGSARRRSRGAAVAVDFSVPQRVAAHARACAAARVPILVGATGHRCRDARADLEAAAQHIPVLDRAQYQRRGGRGRADWCRWPPRRSGLPTMWKSARRTTARSATRRRAPRWPWARRWRGARGRALARSRGLRPARRGARRASPAASALPCVRAGDIVGEHTVTFAAAGERSRSRIAPPTASRSRAAPCGRPHGWSGGPRACTACSDVLGL